MPSPKIKSIYDALKGGGADVGTEQEFNNWFLAKGDQGYKNRKYVWDTMKAGGADVGANYEEFRDWLGLVPTKPQKTQKTATVSQQSRQPQAAEPNRPKTTMEMAAEVGFGNFNPKAAVMPTAFQTPGAGAVISPQTGKPVQEEPDEIAETVNRYATGRVNEQDKENMRKRGQQLKDEFDYAKETGGGRLQEGNLVNIPGQVNTVARDEEGNIMRNDSGQLLRGITTDESRVLASGRYNEDVDKRLAEDENLKALKEGIEKQLLQTRDNGNEGFDELAIAHKAVKDAEELISEMNKQKRGNSIGDFFRNVWRGLKSENIFSVADDLTNNVHVMSAIDKYQSDPSSLTDAEKILLDAVAFKNVIDQEYNPQMSRAAKAGQTTGGSIPLMADIAMNPLSGLGKSMAKKVGTKVLRNAAEKAVASGAERAISKGAARAARFAAAGGNLAGNIVSAAGMTATVSSPRVISDAQQRMIGDIQSEYDENGLLRFKGTEGGDTAFDAYRKAFVSNAIENFTEIQSSMLLGALGMAGRTIPGVRGAMNGFKATALGQMWNAAGRSQLGRMARNVAERTGLHDFPGESLEEIEGGILNAIFVGDQTIADTFEQDNLIDIGLGVAPMQMFFAAVNLGGYGYTSRRAKRALREADSECQIYFGEEGWQQMKQTIDETKDVNELKSVLSNVVNGGQYSTQAKQAAFRYAAAREGYKGAVLGEAAARELDFGKKSRVDHTLVVDKTVTTFDKEGKELETKTFDTDDEVQGYMTEIRMRRKNDDMLSDIEAMQKKGTKREALFGEVGYAAAFSDKEWTGLMWEAMQQAGYDESRGQDDPTNQAIAQNVLQVGTMENDILKEVVNKYNPLQRLHHNVAENHGISDGELQRILDKDPLKRTDEQQAIVDEYATQLHELAYEPGEPHIEQSAQDGASAADDADGGVAGIDPAVVQSEKERYDAAIAARDEALKNNQAMAMRIEELQSYGVDAAGIIAELGEFDENDVKAVIEGYNAEYRWQSFLDKANQNFEATTQRETDRRTFKGTLNGAEQKENMVNVTDGQNTYTLVGGDVTTDADGRVTGGGNANALVVLDENGDMAVLHPESTLTVMPGENLADWGAAFLQQLQEQGSAAVAPAEGTESTEGTEQTEGTEEAPAEEQPAREAPEGTAALAEGAEGVIPAEEAPAGEQPTEGAPAEGAPAEGAPAEGEGEQPVIPTNEKGRKLYHQGVELDVAIDDILNEEAPDNDVNALANRRIKTAQRKLDDLNKDNKKLAKQFEDQDFDDDEYDDVRAAQRGEELPYGTALGVYAQQRMEQEAIINYYNKLKNRYAARRAAEILAGEGAAGAAGGRGASGNNGNNGNNEPVGDENVPDWTVDKASDARARGYRMENGHRVDRQEPITDKQEGNETEVKFDKAEEPVKGRLTVVDSGSLIPSHVNGQRNVKYFITEAQPKERTDADSENSSTAIAENVNPEEITGGVTAYTGSPVVNSRGEVIQGNNRTIGLQKMWGNDQYGESQQKYKQYLMDHAEEFGLDAAAIEQMENPVLVRMVDVSDDEAIRLGQKTAANTESGGTERIDANRVLNQLGDKFDTFVRLLFAGAEEEDMTLMGMIVKNGVSVLKWLNDGRNHAKFISDTEYQSCFDKKGNLTEEAKQDLQKIVEGMLFADAPDNLRQMFYRLPAKAQNAILATFFRDAQSPKESSIIKDIQNAIEAFEVISNASPEFKAAKSVNDARVAVKDVQKQTAMFGNTGTILEKFDNFALELAIIFKVMKQNTIRDYFNAYYDAVQGKGGDIFSEAVTKTKAEAIRDIFGVETNNQEENGQEGNGPLEGGSNDGTGGEPGNAGESGSGEPPAQGEQPAVGGGGTAGTGEVSEREQWIADHPLSEAEIDASDAPQMRKNLAKGYLNGTNESQLAKAAYTSIYNKKGSPTQTLPSRESGETETPGTATGSQPTGQSETPQGEAPQGEVPASGGQSAAGGMSAATAAANAKVQAILARMKAHGKNDEDNDIDHDDISSRYEQSYTDKNGNYHEGLKEEAERLENEIAASSVPASEELDDRSQQGETVERRRRRALIEDELARRESARQALRQRYDIDKDGNISLDNLARMFRDLNSNEAIGKLFDKVYAVLKKLRVDFRFTEKLPGGVNGRALGFVNVTFYNWDAQTQNISNQQKARILLHEMIHNVTSHILVYYKNATTRALLTPSQISAAKKLNAIYKRVKEISPKRKNGKPFYGLDEVDEMVSELANPEFREALDRIEYENKTIWQKIKDAVKEILGFAVFQRKGKALKGVEDALDAILDSYGVFGRIIHASPRSLIDIVKKLMHDNVSIVDEMESDTDDYLHKNLIVEDADEYSITGLTDEQIDDMLELVEAGAELGYTLLDGVQTKDEWTAQMRGLIGESLKDATGYTDAEVDELLEDLWNAPYENEWGDTNTIAEYAAEKGITINNNDNGTEEGTGNGDTGTSGSGTVGSGSEGGVGENIPNNGGSTGTGGETSNGTNTSGSNSGSGEGRPSLVAGRPRESGTPAAKNGRGTRGSNTNRGASNGRGTNGEGGTQSSGEQPAVPGGTSSVGQPERVTPKKPLADVSKEKAPYVPASIGGKYAIGSVVPSGVADAIAQAFKRLREQHKKEILDFVRDELGYSSDEEMLSDFDSGKTNGLAAEQVDAVALAISAMKSGKSFIVGDMTGVGKGRTAAALIRWGKKQGKKVLFITERSSLFSDMHRDLTDIGCDYMPFVTNSDSDANITDSDGNKVIPKPSVAAQSALWQREDDELPRDEKGRQYDFVMTTYSQASNPRNTSAKNKLEWLSRYAKDAIVIMDESHNASGESNRGEYFKDIVQGAEGVTFLSATYAKRPDNMLLYALRSSMSETHMSTGDMLQAIKDYGVPMQEMMAAALYGSGEMIRRERDMSDVKTTWTDPKVIYSEEEYEQCRKTSDKTMDLVNDIIDFQRTYVDPIVKAHEESFEQANTAAAITGMPQTHANNTPYSSQVSNVVNLMVYAMKAKKAAQMAIEQIKQGKKPVIAVENTLESYVKELDDDVREAGFGPIFEKGVRFSLKYSIAQYIKKDGKYEKDKKSEVIYDAESELDEDGLRALENLRKRVEAYVSDKEKVDLSLSPIDLIKQMIADAGYNCGEITGRKYQLERKADGKGFWKTRFKAKKKDVARQFNGGTVENPLPEKEQYQALILNVAGATGISLHSSKKFGNQQPRTMIILQPARDVNIEVQMRGRIDRTGQVHRGEYFYVTSPIPAEQKMTMMLRQKLASLDAQSVGTKDVSSNKVESQDMDNKYGDEVCKNFLLEHLNDINAFLDNGLRYNNKTREWEGRPGLLYDVLKNLQRMSCEMQEMVINELTQRYQDQIDYLNQNGINDLETTTMNLEAVTIDKATFVKGKDNESVNEFAHDTTIERVEVNVLKKPMRSSDIKKKMKDLDALDEDGLPKEGVMSQTNDKVAEIVKQKYEERQTKFAEQEAKLETKIRAEHPRKEDQSEEEWENMIQNWPSLQEMRMRHQADLAQYGADLSKQQNMVYKATMYLKPGRPYLVPLTDDVSSDSASMYGRFLGFQLKNGDPRNVQAVFAVKDSRAMISVPIVNQQKVIDKILADRGDTEIMALERTEWGEDLTMEQKAKKWDEWWDKMIPKNTNRQIRYMITGNVLQACGSLGKYKGQIVTFTRRNKETGEITLERGMLLAENFDPENFKVRRAVVKKDIWEHYDEVKDEKSNISCSRQGDTLIVKFERRKGEKLTDHPANKDATLKALAMNGEIRPSGKTAIMCVVKEANVDKALEHLYKEYGYTKEELFVMPDSTEKPDAIVRTNRPYQEIIDQYKDKYGSEWLIDSKIKQMLKRYKMDVNNEGLKQEIREAVQLRQAYLRKRYAQEESNRLAWQVLIEDERINDAGDNKEYRESRMRIREAMLEELEFRGFKGTALHLEQGKMTFDDVRSLFDQMNDVSTEEGKAKKALFEKVMAKVSKLPMEIALDETIDSNTGGWAGGRVIHYNWKYMNADYIANQAKADTILHELIHTVTAYADRCVEDGYEHLLDQDMVDAINELHSIYNAIERDDTFVHNGVRAYGLWNVREMLSEAGSNSQFRADLKKTGLWAKLKSGFLTFFGIKQTVQGGKQTTAYQEIMDRLDYLIENFKQEAWEEYYKGTRYGGYQRLDAQRNAQQRTQKMNAAQRRSAEAFARRQFERAKMRAKEWSDKLKIGDIMDVYESIDDVPGADKFLPRKRAARGWFDPDTGRITVVIGNHRDPDDVVTTILHEAVAHHGLRKLFGENFDNFLDNVYKSSEAQIRAAINELLPKYNGDKRRATEEYLATLAENTDFERAGTTSAVAHWFNNVKQQFLSMLAKIGLRDYRGVELSDNELRYILWRSYKNMEEPGRYRNRFNIPEVTSMEEKLGVGNGARIVRMGFIEDEIPAGLTTRNDEVKIRERVSKMSLREAQAAYDRINAQMLDENGLNIDEHTDKVRLDWLSQHGREGLGKAMADDLEALQNKYGSAMIVLRWELQDRLENLQKSNVREEPLFRDGIEDDVEQNGLRGAVGDENYRKYMRDLWISKDNQEMHQWVTEHLAENDFNLYDTIDKYLKQAAENGEGSQEMWETVRDGLKEATGAKRMSLRDARWLSWLNGRKGDRSNPDDSMKKSAVRWRIGRRRDTARLTPDGRSYAGVGPDVDMTDEMAAGNTSQTNLAKLWYHEQLDSWSTQWTEAYVDYAVSMKKLMFALTGAREVFDVADDENFYVAENHMSSIVSQKEFQFMRDHWTPLQNAVDACLPDLDSDVEKAMSALEDYMRAKHGLERNREFFVRDWILAADKTQKRGLKNAPTVDLEQLRQDWEAEKRAAWSSLRAGRMTYRQYLETLDDFIKNNVDSDWDSSLLKNDRSGIRNYAHQTDDAFEEDDVISDIEDVENVLGNKADALWEAINDVTDYSLDSDYEAGLISKENRDHVGQMFHFYVPLRGFNEKVANEVYDYMGIPVSNPVGLATLMKAKGRKSLSDSPLAVMGAMATSAISRGERNKVKQKLLRLVRNHYNAKNKERLVSLSKIWLENVGTEDNPIWEERWPEFNENDSADEIARKVEDFNKDMEQKRAAGMAMPRRANLRIPYRAKEAEKRQHMVEVKENGESYLVIINGDPRAAQAMNGLLTPGNAEKNHTLGLLKPVLGPLNRFLSSAFTTWNPTFVLRNTLRDAIMSRSVVLTKEGEGYLMRFRANWYRLLWPELLNGRLWKKYRNGTLDESNFLEKCFKEFMEGGGETGYVEQKNVDKWRKMLLDGSKEYARKHGGIRRRTAYSTSQVAKAAVGLIEDYNERAENLARFATYLTSRQIGRSQLRSVADAKDVSVNFNRKGAGGSSADKNFLAGTTAELFKSLYLFFNAGMQSLALMARNVKKHPVRFMSAQFVNHFVMGVTMPLLNRWLVSLWGDDDTSENPYANLPEWTRRNNLCFFVGGNDWVTIPLPIELRAFYGLGDIAAGYFIDPELKSLKSPAEDFVAQLSQILPVDFMGEGGDVLSAFVPDAVKPLTQVKNNKDWTGKPIQKKESEWNKYDPEWTKAFRSTDKNVVGAARWLSNVTGGDDVKPGKIDISPAYALHILKGYTGGLGQTVTEVGGIIRDVAKWDFEDFNMRNVPLAKAVYNQSDDRTAFYRTRAKYYKYVEDVKKSKHYISGYKKTVEDPMARAELIRMMRKDSMRNLIIDNAQKDLKKLQKAANQTQDRKTRKRYEQLQYRVQEQAVKAVEGL